MTNQELKNKIDLLESNYLELQSQIRDLRSQLTNNLMHENAEELNILIDKIFETVDEETSAVIIGICKGENANYFDGYDKFYKTYKPAIRRFPSKHIETGKHNNWCNTEDNLNVETESALDNFLFLVSNTDYSQSIIPFIDAVFVNGEAEGINECWSGYMAITRDHKLVKFICRDDNMMLNNYKNSPTVLFDFNAIGK